MARNSDLNPDIVVVTKTYMGQEGSRVKAGTRFAVGKSRDGLVAITQQRFQALREARLVRPWGGAEDTAAVDRVRYPNDKAGAGLAQNVRQATRVRARLQDENPEAPKPIAPIGSQTGEGGQPSSSAPAPASPASTSSSRGRRTGGSSR
jgi:hypothetical protein